MNEFEGALNEIMQTVARLKGETLSTAPSPELSLNAALEFTMPNANSRKRVSMKLRFHEGEVGFYLSLPLRQKLLDKKRPIQWVAKVTDPEISQLILSQHPKARLGNILKDLAFVLLLGKDARLSMNRSFLNLKDMEPLKKYLNPPFLFVKDAGMLMGTYKSHLAWGTMLSGLPYKKKSKPKPHLILFVYNEKYPYLRPDVKLMDEKIPRSVAHAYGANEPCVMLKQDWTPGDTIYRIIARTIVWLTSYEIWKETKRWPGL